MVGGVGHAQVGRDLHPAGVGPLDGRVPFGRARGDRPPGGRTGGGPARPARGPSDVRTRPGRRSRRPSGRRTTVPRLASCSTRCGEYLVDVREGVDGRLGFHARVAGNVVAIVERELALGDRSCDASRRPARRPGRGRRRGTGFADPFGAFDGHDWHTVAAVVRESVRTSSPSAIPDTGCRTAGRPGQRRLTGGDRVMGAGGARPRVTIVSPHFDDAPLSLGQSLLDGRLSGCRVTVRVDLRPDELDPMGASDRGPRPADRCLAAGRGDGIVGALRLSLRRRLVGGVDPAHRRHGPRPLPSIRTSTSTTIRWSGPSRTGSGPFAGPRTSSWCRPVSAITSTTGSSRQRRCGWPTRIRPAWRSTRTGRTSRSWTTSRSAASLRRLRLELTPEDVSGPIRERTHRWLRVCYPSQIDDLFVESMVRDRERGAHEQIWFPAGSTPPWTHESLGGVAPGSPSGSAA